MPHLDYIRYNAGFLAQHSRVQKQRAQNNAEPEAPCGKGGTGWAPAQGGVPSARQRRRASPLAARPRRRLICRTRATGPTISQQRPPWSLETRVVANTRTGVIKNQAQALLVTVCRRHHSCLQRREPSQARVAQWRGCGGSTRAYQ